MPGAWAKLRSGRTKVLSSVVSAYRTAGITVERTNWSLFRNTERGRKALSRRYDKFQFVFYVGDEWIAAFKG